MGFIHIYCGDGKGKTTAALGLAVRAAGAGINVCFVQFMKGGETAELNILRHISEITVMRCDRNYPFFKNMTETDKTEIAECHDLLLA
ncbi:MAG: cob(I)yrinic acid a,c-diamide adenosyltransferase, partial [Oscillospiraceae bacterium]